MRRFAALLLSTVALAASACGGDSSPATPQSATSDEPAVTASATATPPPGQCPVDQAICDFAVQVEAALQRQDLGSVIAPESTWADEPQGIGTAAVHTVSATTSAPARR